MNPARDKANPKFSSAKLAHKTNAAAVCATCRRDRKKCTFSGTEICDRCIRYNYSCKSSQPNPDEKRRKLSRHKCEHCRQVKLKCLPEDRTWPERCERCLAKGLSCSEPHLSIKRTSCKPNLISETSAHFMQIDTTIEKISSPESQLPQTSRTGQHPSSAIFFKHSDFTMAIICMSSIELASIKELLDEAYEPSMVGYDPKKYSLGRIGGHKVVTVAELLSEWSKCTVLTKELLKDFVSLQLIVVIGVSKQVSEKPGNHQGDVIVNQPPCCSFNNSEVRRGTAVNGRHSDMIQCSKNSSRLQVSSIRALIAQQVHSGSRIADHLRAILRKFPDAQAQCPHPDKQDCENLADAFETRTTLHKIVYRVNEEQDRTYILQAACHHGNAAIVSLVLKAGANVDANGGYYGNALQAACSCSGPAIVSLLLEAGADVNACGGHFDSALHVAVRKGDEKVARLLLEAGADVNAQGAFGVTPLHVAVLAGHEELVRVLLKAGADVNADGQLYRYPHADIPPTNILQLYPDWSSSEPYVHCREVESTPKNPLCFEIEGAGVGNNMSRLFVQGVCDYTDTQANYPRTSYAATVATAYTKEFLKVLPAMKVAHIPHKLGLQLQDAPMMEPGQFIGRASELEEIAEALRPFEGRSAPRQLIIGGMGGLGKTQLALQYARKHKAEYNSIFWINASSGSSLRDSFASLACLIQNDNSAVFSNEEVADLTYDWLLRSDNMRWLLILDGYDEPDLLDHRKYIPTSAHGSILITTRLPRRFGAKYLHLKPIQSSDEALHILENRSHRKISKHDDGFARDLAKRLGGFPLAIATAGVLLQESTLSIEKYLEEFKQRRDLDPRCSKCLPEYSHSTLYSTWTTSFEQLKKECPPAADLLGILAKFDNCSVPSKLLLNGLDASSPDHLQAVVGDAVTFGSIIGILIDYCFVEVEPNTMTYSVQSGIHNWISTELTESFDPQALHYIMKCIQNSIHLERETPLGLLGGHWLLGYAVKMIESRPIAMILAKVGMKQLLDFALDLIDIFNVHGALEAGELLCTLVFGTLEQGQRFDSIDTLKLLIRLGNLHRLRSRYSQADEVLMRALHGSEQSLGNLHTTTLDAVFNLGMLYEDQNKLAKAELMYYRALEGYAKTCGHYHSSTLDVQSKLGSLFCTQGLHSKAENNLRLALYRKEEALGIRHASTLDTCKSLARLLMKQGKTMEANGLYKRVLCEYRLALNDDHFAIVNITAELQALKSSSATQDQADAMMI